MKKIKIIMFVVFGLLPGFVTAQSFEAQQLMLNYTKYIQLKEILDNMYKGYKILSSGYNTIKAISEGNFNLHKVFLDGLYAVNPSIAKYKRVPDIIRYQQLIVKEYKQAYSRIRADGEFSASELAYIRRVYSNLLQQSLHNLDELVTIVTATKLRMSDDERLQAIDRLYYDMESKFSFLRSFNSSAHLLAIQRAKERSDVNVIKKLHEVE